MTIEPVIFYLICGVVLICIYKIGYYKALTDSRVDTQKQIDRLDAQNALQLKNLTNKYKGIVNQLLEASQKHQEEMAEQEEIDKIPLYKKEDLN